MAASFSKIGLAFLLLAGNAALVGSSSAPEQGQGRRPQAPERNGEKRVVEQFSIVVKKSERKLYLYDGARLLKTYHIALGSNPKGHKLRQGDGATPEGDYYITHKNPRSKFYLSLGLSYPNIADADAGLKGGLITQAQHQAIARAIKAGSKPLQNTRLGGDIFIHGGGTGRLLGLYRDWTLGCVALENEDIKELFDKLPVKIPVRILP
jgi:murein L,D-transpeptidase YafK